MEKTRIDLSLLLPKVPDEKDACVHRIIATLSAKKGIEKVHLAAGPNNDRAQLCFHYDPEVTTIKEVEQQAKIAGAEITSRYGHLLFEVGGIRQPRHARLIEEKLRALKGVLSVSVSAADLIQVEFDQQKISEKEIRHALAHTDIWIKEKGQPDQKHGAKTPPHTHRHEQAGHNHAHEEGHPGLFGERTELIFSLICGFFLASGFALSFIAAVSPAVVLSFYIGAYLFGGFYTSKEAIQGISKGNFEIDFLMLVAALGAAILGQWSEGALLLFLFSLGHSLEHYAMEKAHKSIAALTDLAPKTALLKGEKGEKEVSIEVLKPGDIIIIKPNSKIAADGIVVAGSSSVNQASITGESMPADKTALDTEFIHLEKSEKLDEKFRVFAGTLNGRGALEVKVTRPASDSTLARLIQLVNEAQTQKSATQHFTDRLERYYVPAVLLLVTLLLFAFLVIDESFSKSFYRAMAVLIAASPCALAISTPSAVLSGIARAARGGVLVKGGGPLEDLGSLSAVAFDKTGTLTEGKPKLTGVYPFNGVKEEAFLRLVVAVEKLSDHPLAAAIVKGGQERFRGELPQVLNASAINGRGITAEVEGSKVFIGNRQLFEESNITLEPEISRKVQELEQEGQTTMLVWHRDHFAGLITLMDVARKDAQETLQRLGTAGIKKMIMLTGDNQRVAEAIARKIGITDAMGNLLPEQKVEAIEQLKRQERAVAMVGDGVNDAPAMVKSTVGIAMGAAGSDVALETADIALMADRLSNLPFAIGLSRQARRIIRQNVVISLGMVVILIPLTLLGYASMGPAVIGHEGSTIIVVFNALRLLAYRQ